jgi:hypothetical protein
MTKKINDEEQIKFLKTNFKSDKDFKLFFNLAKFIEYTNSIGEKYPDEILDCFKPENIKPYLWKKWTADYFSSRRDDCLDPGTLSLIFPNIIPESTNLKSELLFRLADSELGETDESFSGHDFYYFEINQNDTYSNWVMHHYWSVHDEDETHVVFYDEYYITEQHHIEDELIDKTLSTYLQTSINKTSIVESEETSGMDNNDPISKYWYVNYKGNLLKQFINSNKLIQNLT